MAWHRWDAGDLLLELRVQPRAARDELVATLPRPRLRVQAPATDDRANRAAIEWLARAFGVAKTSVELVRGRRGRDKQFRIRTPAHVPAELGIVRSPAPPDSRDRR